MTQGGVQLDGCGLLTEMLLSSVAPLSEFQMDRLRVVIGQRGSEREREGVRGRDMRLSC